MESSTTNKPVQVFRSSGLSASIFRNEAEKGTPFFKVSLQRTCKDGDDFKTTTSLSRDDLPVASLLLQRAWAYIVDTEKEPS